MKLSTLSTVIATAFVALSSASALDIPDVARGNFDFTALRLAAKVASCPAKTETKFTNSQLSCLRDVAHFSNSVCGNPAFPRAVSMVAATDGGSERDLCASTTTADGRRIASDTNLSQTRDSSTCPSGTTKLVHSSGPLCLKAGVSFGATANLASFREGTDYTRAAVTQERVFQRGIDFEFLPLDGTRAGFSYVQGFTAAQADELRFRLDQTVAGATDKFKRIEKVRVTPVLVSP